MVIADTATETGRIQVAIRAAVNRLEWGVCISIVEGKYSYFCAQHLFLCKLFRQFVAFVCALARLGMAGIARGYCHLRAQKSRHKGLLMNGAACLKGAGMRRVLCLAYFAACIAWLTQPSNVAWCA